jgi:hypothetical protein
MADELRAFQLLKEHFEAAHRLRLLIDGFDCREDRGRDATFWEQEVNLWLSADPAMREGALYRIRKKDCKVWLYFNQATELIGYGSLGKAKWPDPGMNPPIPDLPMVPISLIPSVGIQTPYHGGPAGAAYADKYSTQILNHLVFEARKKLGERQPFLGLYVHPQNHRAIACYRRYGFIDFPHPYSHPDAGVEYPSMILLLSNWDAPGHPRG